MLPIGLQVLYIYTSSSTSTSTSNIFDPYTFIYIVTKNCHGNPFLHYLSYLKNYINNFDKLILFDTILVLCYESDKSVCIIFIIMGR